MKHTQKAPYLYIEACQQSRLIGVKEYRQIVMRGRAVEQGGVGAINSL